MALAVTHVILTIVLLDLFRYYVFGKKAFPRYLLVVGGVAGLIADIDVPFTWLYNWTVNAGASFHGLYTHSIIFPIIFLVAGFILYHQGKSAWAKVSLVISVGLFFHLVLDCLFGGYTTFLWPSVISTGFCPEWGMSKFASGIDALILVAWLVHEEIHQRIKDYI